MKPITTKKAYRGRRLNLLGYKSLGGDRTAAEDLEAKELLAAIGDADKRGIDTKIKAVASSFDVPPSTPGRCCQCGETVTGIHSCGAYA